MVRPRRIESPKELAEGRCEGMPFSRDCDSSSDSSIHFWMGDRVEDKALLGVLVERALSSANFTLITYSNGAPRGFWTSEEL